MESPQSVVSPFKASPIYGDLEKHKSDFFPQNPGCFSKGIEVQSKESIGELKVYVHRARDIHNICIYHKQDVYAKICLTSDPENTVATKTINGGGQNPVFDDKVHINVQTFDCSLKCEIWMLSRVRNYLEDQLLGFALVPLSEVLVKNGNIDKEFPLSSTDLFHSPAGFVQLSLSYTGASPDVIAIPSVTDTDADTKTLSDFEKIEFPDPKIANENHIMVSEYFGYPSQSSESFVSSETETQIDCEMAARFIESFSNEENKPNPPLKHNSPPSSVSTNGYSKSSPSHESGSPLKEKRDEEGDAESNVSPETFIEPVINVSIEPEQKVVQQDIVDMYMKSMQQFTESLAKMKLPMDIESGPPSSESSISDQKASTPASKNGGPRVFYGSRAFF